MRHASVQKSSYDMYKSKNVKINVYLATILRKLNCFVYFASKDTTVCKKTSLLLIYMCHLFVVLCIALQELCRAGV